ncbi:right-handed parallel beta-helix repeat-containing protein [Planctomycetota bacterium]
MTGHKFCITGWILVIINLLPLIQTVKGRTFYVDGDATGANNGTNWENAYQYLQDALENAQAGRTICVADGIYRPDQGKSQIPGDRKATFQLKIGVKIIGGYAGFGEPNPNAQNIQEYETILSGDLHSDDEGDFLNNGENSYHVVTGSDTDATAILDNITVTAGNANGDFPDNCGGGMLNMNSNPTLNNCIFTENSADWAGGMHNRTNSNPTITDCNFIGNSASEMGGGMYNRESSNPAITSCTFDGNSAQYGGGMYNRENSNPSISNCTFSGNSASERAGGMYNRENSNPTITNCIFSGNSAVSDGGGMRNYNNSSPTIVGCTFSGNLSGNDGGGVYNHESNANIVDCNFTDNETGDDGAGIYNYYSTANVTDCNFTDNETSDDGAGIYNYYSTANVTDCNFTGNLAKNDGGSISNYHSDANLIDCRFTENTAHDTGGAIYNTYSHPYINDCNFTDNLSHKYGGGIYNNDSNSIIIDCRFNGNDANDLGGAIYNLQSHPDINDCNFTDNLSHDDGGGIYNNNSNANIVDCRFTKNAAYDNGGGLYNYDSNSVITDCNFISNTATGRGGGIYCKESKAQISQCRFHGNLAHVNGGGLYNKDDNSFVTGCNFIGNTAINKGGGIYCKESEPQISQCRFHNNKADKRGGGMYNSISNSFVIDCNFFGNIGYDAGGAISNNSSNPIIARCTLENNCTLDGDGAGIFNGLSSPTITDCLFIGNTSSLNGGGIADWDSNSTLTNCVFSGNRAKQAGGAIKSSEDSMTNLANCTLSKNIAREKGGGIQAWSYSTINVSNSILWGNKPEEIDIYPGSISVVTYSNVQGYWDGIGNKDEDPLFIDEDGLDNIVGTLDDNLRLLAGSPCIDAGSNSDVPSEPIDLDNDGILAAHIPWDLDKNPRFIELVDMGAYEGPQGDFRPEVNVSSLLIHEGGTAEFSVTLSAPPTETIEVKVKWQSGDPDISVGSDTVLVFDANNYADPQTVKIQAEEDADYLPGTAVIEVTITGQMSKAVTVTESDDEPAPRTLFVDWQTHGKGDGTSWDNAFTDLQPALEVARLIPGMVDVYVAAGTYTPSVETDVNDLRSATFKLNPGMALFGGFAGSAKPDPDERDIDQYKTVLSGYLHGNDTIEDVNSIKDVNSLKDNAYHVIEASDTDATSILDGFVITGGNANQWGNSHDVGGAIRINRGSPIIRNCRLEDNTALFGGGMYCLEGAPTLINCVISDNSVTFDKYGGDGGGIYFDDCNAVLINCTFVNNMAFNVEDVNDVSFDGGGIYFYRGNPRLTGCQFMGNVASDIGGGMRCYRSVLTAVNCIFSGNIANGGAAIDTTNSSPTFTNCTISRNIALDTGGAIYNGRGNYPVLTNCILWGNIPDEITFPDSQEMPTILNYCVIQGGWTNTRWQPIGEGNLDVDPRFIDPNGPDGIAGTLDDDLMLLPDSPCIDAGNNMADTDANDIYAPGIQPLPGIDVDFYVRWHDDPHTADTGKGTEPIVDIGAYEFGSEKISSVLYVDNKARKGKNNGTNWQDAFLDLQTALRTAFVAGDRIHEIWIASGTYTPTPPGGSRDVSFNLVDGVGLFGGFAGDEISWETRDPNNNLTILSGDLQGDDGLDPANNRENSYHIVRAVGVGPATILDGFIIESSNADVNDTIDGKGGGLYIESASPEISNCIFWDNTAADHGSAIYASLSVPTFFDCMITDNHPKGIWMEYGQARIEGVLKIFSDVLGGGMISYLPARV